MRVSSDVFDAVLLTACRASVLLATTSGDETAGIDKASQFEEAANVAADRIQELISRADSEDFAKEMGWPSSGALVAFLFDGPSARNHRNA